MRHANKKAATWKKKKQKQEEKEYLLEDAGLPERNLDASRNNVVQSPSIHSNMLQAFDLGRKGMPASPFLVTDSFVRSALT